MINRKCLLRIFSIFFITIIFSEEQKILWDFGVQIKPAKSLSSTNINNNLQTDALVANRFVPPDFLSSIDKKIDKEILLNSNYTIILNNINEVENLAAQLTIKNDFQAIINMIAQIDLSQFNNYNYSNLYYWLANAYFHIGKYLDAEDILLSNNALGLNDHSHFLLAMIYENQGRKKYAKEKYLQFSQEFPTSDLLNSALIKIKLLNN